MFLLLALLAAAAAIVDDPSRWSAGAGIFTHAAWDGVLASDLVTPVFLFFLGAALSMRERAIPLSRILAAALLLAACGLVIGGVSRPFLPAWRVTGVLQRAGVTLAVAGVLNAGITGDFRRRIALLASIAASIALTYWLVMAHVPPPLGSPGDLSSNGNLAAWVDRAILGAHAWSERWDPDGILSTLASISTVLAGIVAGIALTSHVKGIRNVLQLAGAGAGAMAGGLLWTPMVPINRSLWSASFTVFSGGAAAMLLAAWSWSQRRERRKRRG